MITIRMMRNTTSTTSCSGITAVVTAAAATTTLLLLSILLLVLLVGEIPTITTTSAFIIPQIVTPSQLQLQFSLRQQQHQQQNHDTIHMRSLIHIRSSSQLYTEPIRSSSSSSSSSSSNAKSNATSSSAASSSSASSVLPFMAATTTTTVKTPPTVMTTTTVAVVNVEQPKQQEEKEPMSDEDDVNTNNINDKGSTTSAASATTTTTTSSNRKKAKETSAAAVAASAVAPTTASMSNNDEPSEDLSVDHDDVVVKINDIQVNNDSQPPQPSFIDDTDINNDDENDTTTIATTIHDNDSDIDIQYMKMAIELAQMDGGEHGPRSAYPNPTVGAVLVRTDMDTGIHTIIGRGRSDYRQEAVRACLVDAGYVIASLSEWVVSYPIVHNNNNNDIENDTSSTTTTPTSNRQSITLYTTLEPSTRRRGTASPPVTNLIRVANIHRVVIGCPSPVLEKALLGATVLHQAGIQVSMIQNEMIRHECHDLIHDFSISSNGKLQRMARKHYQLFGRPLGFLHCSVINSDNIEAFRRNGNAFAGRTGSSLSYRNFGTYELAPPPDNIWAATTTTSDDDLNDDNNDMSSTSGTSIRIDDEFVMIDFEDEDVANDDDDDTSMTTQSGNNARFDGSSSGSPMMPWYNQVDAIVATFPRSGNGPPNDDSIMARLNGLKWLATHGNILAAGVERILVLDATELRHLPLHNTDPNLPMGVDIESFWTSVDRKPIRLLLRRGVHEAARAAAVAASMAAQAAADAAEMATNAIESGDATLAATTAIECANTATSSKAYIDQELETTQIIRRKLEDLGVIIETLSGGEPIDVMEHLGTRNGLYSVVWRAGCWGERGVRAILAGAFQWVSAHIAVPAEGGRFWQLMMAENAVQGACGPQSKVKVFADQDDISMEYCSDDDDCVLSVDGKPIRHVRIDCRIALVDAERPREFDIAKTQTMNRKVLVEQAPWFL